ncbi:RNA-directed DNA polymerase [Pseudomonas siliginis]|uniref:RNA-directed DNA polymerase n=1 Tax=Pseudomonas siliginis TaxID=2842346 RepID=UPI001C3E4A5B|nr:RNA-directed DNA polymerase [Pseudomonas siliginis]MBV4467486.1 RNA-directed DNA polymerase [Pseudomonas siliginis]
MVQETDTLLYQAGWITANQLFERMFSPLALEWVFRDRFKGSLAKGIDRINGFQFCARSAMEFEIVSGKCLDGSFRFAPYLEQLKLKGRGKEPRIISIPTIRDRVVLHQLQKYLALVFPDQVPRNVASSYVRQVALDVGAMHCPRAWVCSTDIRKFYDSIDQDRIVMLVSRKIKNQPILGLIGHALRTPTVPKNTPRKQRSLFRQDTGVPQGLAISNILAAIYMADVDQAMRAIPGLHYYRYVDDVLMYGDEKLVSSSFTSLKGRLSRRGLKLHSLNSEKTKFGPLDQEFAYLGYIFKLPEITVRRVTVERFLQSIAAKISDYKHNKSRRLEKFKYLTESRLVDIFYLELNEKITGAISQNKRYGWVAYFNQITNEKLLHEMDGAIRRMVSRVPELAVHGVNRLKKLARAYFSMKYDPRGGYIRDYDVVKTTAEKLSFLESRGRIDPAVALTEVQILERYDHYIRLVLARMHEDEGEIY